MKPDMCIGMLNDLEEKDVQVRTIIMNNNTTTIARARTEVNPALKKQGDKNHTLKQFTNKLYDLIKWKKYKELNPKTIIKSHFKVLHILCQLKSTWLGWHEETLGGYKQTCLSLSQLVWILVWVFIITDDLQTLSVATSPLSFRWNIESWFDVNSWLLHFTGR